MEIEENTKQVIDLCFGSTFLFPYTGLSEISNSQNYDHNDQYNIYYFLEADNYQILDVVTGDVLRVVYLNLTTKKEGFIEIDFVDFLIYCNLPFWLIWKKNHLIVKKAEIDRMLTVTYICEEIDYNYHFDIECILRFEAISRNGIYNSKFKILYIGQSQQSDILNRLRSHEKLIEIITKESGIINNSKSLYILLHSLNAEVINSKHFSTGKLVTTNKIGRTLNFTNSKESFTIKEAIDIVEMSLIKYFKPKYNTVHKRGNEANSKSFSKTFNNNIDALYISLDYNFDDGNQIITLYGSENQNSDVLLFYEIGKQNGNQTMKVMENMYKKLMRK